MQFGYSLVANWGFAILFATLVLKAVLWPLSAAGYRSAAKMRAVAPKIQDLQQKYSNDKQKLGQEMMNFYKSEGVSPLGGCLPMLLQMPIFFALYSVFSSTIELRQAPFVLWITDLSKPDSLPLGGFDLHVLPLLMAGSMFVQQKMTMKDPKQAMLVYMMPVMMIYIFWTMSSG